MKRVCLVSETYKDLVLGFVSLLMIYVGRPVPYSHGDGHHVQVILRYSVEAHQLPKLLALFLSLTMTMTQAITKCNLMCFSK
jgi:hypothetical protein